MSKVRVASYGISLDGFGAGPDQSLENPLGVGFPEVMGWFFPTRVFQKMHGQGELLDIALALGTNRLLFRFGQCRQQHGGENRDDRDHHQQFDQRETPDGNRF